jgi:FixJ family two-component response regulator
VIHLPITDVVMPGMNGRPLARHLLSLSPHLRHLFMSGFTADVIAHDGVLDEGVHFVQKPFSTGDLAAKVRTALDTPIWRPPTTRRYARSSKPDVARIHGRRC